MKKNKSFLLLFLSVLMVIGMIHMPAQAAEKGTVVIKCAESKKGISDATFAVYVENVPGKKSGLLIGRATTGSEGLVYADGLEPGDYFVVEENVPEKYELEDSKHAFTIADNGSMIVSYQYSSKGKCGVTIEENEEQKEVKGEKLSCTGEEYYQSNAVAALSAMATDEGGNTTVHVSITDVSTGSALEGVSITVKDEAGSEVASWVSNTSYQEVKNLVDGKKYYAEVKYPSGYVNEDPFEFTALDGLNVNIKAEPISLQFSCVDETDGAMISGAEFELLSEGGKVVEKITSSDSKQKITKLDAGTYTLKQTKTNEGYVKAKEETVEIKNSSDGNEISVKNKRVKGHVIIKVTDAKKNNVTGASFVLKAAPTTVTTGSGSEGSKTDKEQYNQSEAIETITSENGVATTSDVEIGVYENGVMKTKRVYYISQESAPDGLTKSDKIYKVQFKYADDETEVVEESITLANKGEAAGGGSQSSDASSEKSSGSQTSDVAALALMIAMAVLVCVLGSYVIKRKKMRK